METFDHEILDMGRYDRRSAWLWLITNAAWKERRVNHKGRPITLKRGQLLGARAFLAEKFGWGEQELRTFLKALVTNGMVEINQSNGHFANVITICNYEKYQSAENVKDQASNQSLTSVQPEPNQISTKDTSYTNTADDTRARSIDCHELYDKLTEAANGSLYPLAIGLHAVAEPLMWIRQGADLDLDILPVIRDIGHRAPKGSIRTWSYFAGPVSTQKARREKGLPPPGDFSPRLAAGPRPSAARAVLEARKAREVHP
ncbi:hypothetical protein [Hyphomicrobium sp. 1Nfss2.1]|uniref:hypothetical protein n=1 Tax=Hyphomicrobium sp. 1Nfss2.1 TaxID=3413936 RepID=UPI003C7CB948